MAQNKPSKAFDMTQKMILAFLAVRAAMEINKSKILLNDVEQFIRDNREGILSQNTNLTCTSFNPYASLYLTEALKAVKIYGVKMVNRDDGSIMIAVPNKEADKLDELRKQVDILAKSFCTDKNKLKEHMAKDDQIINVPKESLSESQLFMLTSELTNAGASYYLDAENQTISYLKSQEGKVKQALFACAAEMSSKDSNYYSHYFKKTGELYEEIMDMGENLKDGESKYIVSADRINKDGIFALKITNSSYTEIKKDQFGQVVEGKTKPIDYNSPNDMAILCLQTRKYDKPLIVDANYLNDTSPTRLKEIMGELEQKTRRTYSSLERDNNDRLIVNFVRDAFKNGVELNLYGRNSVSDIYNEIKNSCENSDNLKTQIAWDRIKDIPQEQVEQVLASYKANAFTLNEIVIKNAEPERAINKDRE